MKNAKCKICRRAGVKLFLKGDKCLSPKCLMIKKAYPPGLRKRKSRRVFSEYAKELKEKQKLKNWYGLKERQFQKYVKEILAKREKVEDTGTLLIRTLESRLDNVVFQLGFASSRLQARQLISHHHFLVNDKVVNISSFLVKKGDRIKIRPISAKKPVFQNLIKTLKKAKPLTWLELNIEKLEGKVLDNPTLEVVNPPVEISSIFEYYSK